MAFHVRPSRQGRRQDRITKSESGDRILESTGFPDVQRTTSDSRVDRITREERSPVDLRHPAACPQDRSNPRNLECRLCHPQQSIEAKLAPGNTVYGMGLDPRGYDKISAGCHLVVQESVDHIWLDVTAFLSERVASAEDVKAIFRGTRRHNVRFRRVEPLTKMELDPLLLRPLVQDLVDRVPLVAPP